MLSKKYHPYHLVDNSPWPYIFSNMALMTTISLMLFMHFCFKKIIFISLMITMMILFAWFSDMVSEGTYMGLHTLKVLKGFKMGMILFMISEMFFFISFFWSFFHSSLAPSMELSCNWPPQELYVLNLLHHPLVNTIFLLFSATTVTVCHHSMMSGKKKLAMDSLMSTLMFGFWFMYTQSMEYLNSSYTFADSVYGSTFFITTGFHGFHVMVGMIFLSMALYSLWDNQYSTNHHFGFEAAVWYWHFVDVVWLFLFICIYWWGS